MAEPAKLFERVPPLRQSTFAEDEGWRIEIPALPELAAEDVRLAARSLGRITGRVDVEDVLDVIFRDFCIGK